MLVPAAVAEVGGQVAAVEAEVVGMEVVGTEAGSRVVAVAAAVVQPQQEQGGGDRFAVGRTLAW